MTKTLHRTGSCSTVVQGYQCLQDSWAEGSKQVLRTGFSPALFDFVLGLYRLAKCMPAEVLASPEEDLASPSPPPSRPSKVSDGISLALTESGTILEIVTVARRRCQSISQA